MAKKRRKRRPPPRPAATGTAVDERPPSARAERKELARRERERRVKQARRRQRLRRAGRWGIAAAVVAGVAGFVVFQVRQGREQEAAAAEAAGRINCAAVETTADLTAGLSQAEIHSPPFVQGQNGVPATNGRHSSALPPDPAVYEDPVPEENIVHNLEHGYVVVYYAADGDHALPDDVRTALEDLAGEQDKVLMAPYPDLANGFDLVAWRKLQTCDPPPGAEPDDAVTVAQGFIDRFRSGGLAPEPQGV